MKLLYVIRKRKAVLDSIFDIEIGNDKINLAVPDKILDISSVVRIGDVEESMNYDAEFLITKLPEKLESMEPGPFLVGSENKIISGNYRFGIVNGMLLSVEKLSEQTEEGEDICIIPEGVRSFIKEVFWEASSGGIKPKAVILPSTMKKIGSRFFTYSFAKKVIVPDSVKEIEENAFYNNTIEEIILPKRMDYIGFSAFNSSTKLKSIRIPKGIKELSRNLFLDCTELEEVILPEGLERIEQGAFWDCNKLREINIPESVNFIGKSAFYSTTMLKEIKLPEKITTISNGLFWRSGIRKITIHKNIKRIEGSAFHKCFDLASVEFEEGCEEIDSAVFIGCQSLKIIKLPKSIKKIEKNAFCGIPNLEIIYIPETIADVVTTIKDYFYNCPNLEKICSTEDESLLYWEKNKNSQ